MERRTVNTVVTLAVIAVASLLYARPFFPSFFEKSHKPTSRILLPAPSAGESEAALAKMRSELDKVEGFTHYRAKTTPTNMRQKTGIYVSFVKSSTSVATAAVEAAMHVVYAGNDWIFFKSLVSNCDGAKFEFEFNPKRHVAGGRVEEWASIAISERAYFEFLYDCAMAKDSTIRLKGKFIYDHKMSPKEKQAILDTLAAFQALGGSFELPYE